MKTFRLARAAAWPGEFVERLRPEALVDILAALVGGDEAGGIAHCERGPLEGVSGDGRSGYDTQRASSFNPSRMSLALSAPSPAAFSAAATAFAAWSRE